MAPAGSAGCEDRGRHMAAYPLLAQGCAAVARVGGADVLVSEPQWDGARWQVAVDGAGHDCGGGRVGVPPGGGGQVGELGVVVLIAAAPGGDARGSGRRARPTPSRRMVPLLADERI